MSRFYMAELATRHFDFYAFGETEADALQALRAGIVRHLVLHRLHALGVGKLMEDANVRPCNMGQAYRDGQPIS